MQELQKKQAAKAERRSLRPRAGIQLGQVGIAAICLLLVTAPALLGSPYILHMLVMWGIYALLTLSLTVVIGMSGQLALGQAAFFGVGAYVSAIVVQRYEWPFLGGLVLAALAAAFLGGLIAVPFRRLYGIYLGMATFGFGVIAHLVFRNWTDMTGGTLGMRAIPTPTIFGFEVASQTAYYYLVLAVLFVTMAALYRLINSASGQALLAIREDALAAESLGIPAARYKVGAFALGAAIAGLSGSLFAHYITYISPENFTMSTSILVLTMLIVGGRGSLLGALAGAAILTALPETLRVVPALRIVIYGLLLIVMAVFRPQGIFGDLRWGQEPPRWTLGKEDRHAG